MIYQRGVNWHMDVTIQGVRYREALNTTDKREAKNLEKKRVAEIQQGRGASRHGREFARKPFSEALEAFIEESKPHCAERTIQLYRERGKRLAEHFKVTPLYRISARDVAAYQTSRLEAGAGNRTINMEVTVMRLILRKAKLWFTLAEDVRMLPEKGNVVARVLTPQQKRLLFDVAASRDAWLVAYCAGVVAVNTSCRGIELRTLRWADVDLFKRELRIHRSKTEAGHRTLPLNSDALAAFGRLWERAQAHGTATPESYVFPACESGKIDPTRFQRTWRTAWRALVREAGRTAGRQAAHKALEAGAGIRRAMGAWRDAAAAFSGFRFHDLRHQAITELAEAGHSDLTLMSIAGHMSRKMVEHYSHVRMAAKRSALDSLAGGVTVPTPAQGPEASQGAIQ